MRLLCRTCGKHKEDTNFNFKKGRFNIGLDTSKCQLCINPKMYDEVHKYFRKIVKGEEKK